MPPHTPPQKTSISPRRCLSASEPFQVPFQVFDRDRVERDGVALEGVERDGVNCVEGECTQGWSPGGGGETAASANYSSQSVRAISALVDRGLLWSEQQVCFESPPYTTAATSQAVCTADSANQSAASNTPVSHTLANHTEGAKDLWTNGAHCAEFGIAAIDQVLPKQGLPFGQFHEFALLHTHHTRKKLDAPLWIISSLLAHTLSPARTANLCVATQRQVIVWIGQHSWPTPHLLECVYKNDTWRTQCLFLNPADKLSKLWSISETARRRCIFAVVADASGFAPQAYRKLQLAIREGGGLGLFLRHPEELLLPSPAYSRWCVSPLATGKVALSWNLELRKIKGSLHARRELPIQWQLYWNEGLANGTGALDIFSETTSRVSREERAYSTA